MKSNIFVKYGYMHHRGSPKDSLLSKVYITASRFNNFVISGVYFFVGFDKDTNMLLWTDSNSSLYVFVEVEFC